MCIRDRLCTAQRAAAAFTENVVFLVQGITGRTMNPFRFLGLGRVERKAGPVFFGEDAVTFFFVTGPVVGGTAFRANDNVVSFVQKLMTTAAMAVRCV